MHRLAAVIVAISLVAADWPLFRGDAAQTGVAAEPLPDKLGRGAPEGEPAI